MKATFEKHNMEVPEYIMEVMRQRRYLDPYDESEDDDILEMSGYDFLHEWLEWEGIIGYTDELIRVIEMAFGINLDAYPFDETIERKIGD